MIVEAYGLVVDLLATVGHRWKAAHVVCIASFCALLSPSERLVLVPVLLVPVLLQKCSA